MPAKRDPVIRFWEKVRKSDGCWEWTAGRLGGRYGDFMVGVGDHRSAHRYSWELHFGPIPVGMNVCHHCDNPGCVRPDHLFIGTQKDNLRDMQGKGRKAVWRREGPTCKHGHPWTPDNTCIRGGYRSCRECSNAPRRKGMRPTVPYKPRRRVPI